MRSSLSISGKFAPFPGTSHDTLLHSSEIVWVLKEFTEAVFTVQQRLSAIFKHLPDAYSFPVLLLQKHPKQLEISLVKLNAM